MEVRFNLFMVRSYDGVHVQASDWLNEHTPKSIPVRPVAEPITIKSLHVRFCVQLGLLYGNRLDFRCGNAPRQ